MDKIFPSCYTFAPQGCHQFVPSVKYTSTNIVKGQNNINWRKHYRVQAQGKLTYYVEPTVVGDAPYQQSVITINTFQTSQKTKEIPVNIKWFRNKGNRKYGFTEIKDNTYQLSSEDINTTIQVEISPVDQTQKGTCVLVFGPIKIHPETKLTLEKTLQNGGMTMPIQLLKSTSNTQGQLSLTKDLLRIKTNKNSSDFIQLSYSMMCPLTKIDHLNATHISLIFPKGEITTDQWNAFSKFSAIRKSQHGNQLQLDLQFMTKNQKDITLLAIRCFAANKFLINSKLINNIDLSNGDTFQKELYDKFKNKSNLADVMIEVGQLKEELNNITLLNKQKCDQNKILQEKLQQGDQEVQETIATYTRIINQKSPSVKNPQHYIKMTNEQNTQKIFSENAQLKLKIQKLENELQFKKYLSNPKHAISKYIERENNIDKQQTTGLKMQVEDLEVQLERTAIQMENYKQKLTQLNEENNELKTQIKMTENILVRNQNNNTDLVSQYMNQVKNSPSKSRYQSTQLRNDLSTTSRQGESYLNISQKLYSQTARMDSKQFQLIQKALRGSNNLITYQSTSNIYNRKGSANKNRRGIFNQVSYNEINAMKNQNVQNFQVDEPKRKFTQGLNL